MAQMFGVIWSLRGRWRTQSLLLRSVNPVVAMLCEPLSKLLIQGLADLNRTLYNLHAVPL